jgi:hypothetical protein
MAVRMSALLIFIQQKKIQSMGLYSFFRGTWYRIKGANSLFMLYKIHHIYDASYMHGLPSGAVGVVIRKL